MPENRETSDVVIIGGGPTGLLTACELALAGVRPVVLEQLPTPSTTPRANGLVGSVVPALDHRGLLTRLGGTSPSQPSPSFQFGALWLDMAGMPESSLHILPVPQVRQVQVLTERAVELGADVRPGHEMLAMRQHPEHVEIDVLGPGGAYTLVSQYVVGADGGRSTVRKICGIDFPGDTDRSGIGRTGEVEIDPPAADGSGMLDVPGLGRLRPGTFTRTETGVFAYGMFSPGRYRVAVMEWGDVNTPEREDWSRVDIPVAELAAAVTRVLGAELPMRGTLAQANTTTNSRQAAHYRSGRVFLVGDAAHVQSGTGGPGLNLGLQDALNLGWKLAAAVRGWAPADLLDSYEGERHPVGRRVLVSSRAQTALLRPGPQVTALRQVMQELLETPANVRHLADLMSGGDIRYEMSSRTGTADAPDVVGRFVPDLALETASGPTRVAEVQRDARPRLYDLAGRDGLTDAAAGWKDRVEVLRATTPDAPADALLVRPDGHVAWAGGDAEGLVHALTRWFGAPESR